MNIRLAYVALLFFCSSLLCSQTTKLAKAPDVTAKDFIEKKHPTDTTAVAAYQYHYGNTYFDLVDNYWVMVTEVYNRIKIYKKEGYKYADSKIVFYSGSRKGKGSIYDAVTYNLENGVVTKTPLGAEGIAEDEPVEDYTRKKIKMPNVKVGSIIEYKYKIRTPYFTNLEDFYFQYDIPVDNVRYDVAVPGYFIYNVYTVGYADIQKDEVFVRDNYQLECKELVYKYAAKNVKALPDEPYVNNPDNYTAMIKHELATVSMPNRATENYATDWKNVAKNIYAMDGFGRELKQSSYFEKDIDVVLTQAKTDEEKMNGVFAYVQNRMAWNDKSSYRCKEGVKKAYESHTGNVAEINLMLTAMLRYAGLDANPVLTSTRDNGIAVFPTRTAYNYVIASVKIADKQYLLDATSKYTVPNILPVRTLNWNGRLIKKNGDTEDISLVSTKLGKETVSIQCEIDNKGGIKGKYKASYYDYSGYVYRENYGGYNPETNAQRIEKKYDDVVVSDLKMQHVKELNEAVSEDFSFEIALGADVAGDKMYLDPLLFLTAKVSPFKQEKRDFPIDFIYAYQDRYALSIKIPKGYTVESVPQKLQMAMDQNAGMFSFMCQQKDETIQVLVITQINIPIISQDFYPYLKEFFNSVIAKQNEKIVLKKSS